MSAQIFTGIYSPALPIIERCHLVREQAISDNRSGVKRLKRGEIRFFHATSGMQSCRCKQRHLQGIKTYDAYKSDQDLDAGIG